MHAEAHPHQLPRCGRSYALPPHAWMNRVRDLAGAGTMELQLGAAHHLAVDEHPEHLPVGRRRHGRSHVLLGLLVGVGAPRLVAARLRQAGPVVDGSGVVERKWAERELHGGTLPKLERAAAAERASAEAAVVVAAETAAEAAAAEEGVEDQHAA